MLDANAETKAEIRTSLAQSVPDLAADARQFFTALGYESQRKIPGSFTAAEFLENIQLPTALKEGINESAFRENVKTAAVVCQFGDDEIDTAHSRGILPRGEFEPANIRSFIFIAIDLKPNKNVYGRGVLARITRAINRRLAMPGAVFFRYEEDGTQAITLSFVRREGKRDKTRDIIGRVSMLRGISRQTPHRGHLDILTDLTIKKPNRQKRRASYANDNAFVVCVVCQRKGAGTAYIVLCCTITTATRPIIIAPFCRICFLAR